MIPLHDSVRSRIRPVVSISLILINIVIFIYQLQLRGMDSQIFISRWSVIPALGFVQPWRYLTANFIHGSWSHLLGNMLFLWIFGDNIEDKIGHFKFLYFYLLMGVLALMAQSMTAIQSIVPIIGASGSIAGIMGAYFVCCPRSRVLTYIPPFFVFPIPSFIYLIGWFGLQFFNGVGSWGTDAGVAWWAHVAGFIFGFIVIRFIKPKPTPQPDYYISNQ